ncbi:hypothetical protein [Bradyrhizobium sp. USDA 3364]
MRLILYIVGALFVANIVAATFIWPPEKDAAPEPKVVVNAATLKGQDPWMVKESYNAPYRNLVRANTLKTLDAPWSERCSAAGHKTLVLSINGYYDIRDRDVSNYAEVFGEAARQFALKAWRTPDDNRIERLIGETFARGYISEAELKPVTQLALASEIGKSHASACKS